MKRYFAYVKPLDFVVLAAVVLLALFLLFAPLACSPAEKGVYLAVRIGETETRYSLSEDAAFILQNNGYALNVSISGGQVAVLSSNCPEQHCLQMSPISQSGESILCAKAEILLCIVGDGGGFDAVVG